MSTAYLNRMECPRCGATRADDDSPFDPCVYCAREGVHVNPLPAYGLTRKALEPEAGQPGIYRWRRALPLPEGSPIVSLGEGNTPLVPLRCMMRELTDARVYIKDESRNPTWSYKDRLISTAISRAAADGASTVAVASTGNHGASAAAYAAAAGLRCIVLTLASVPETMKVLMQSYGAQVVALDRPTDRWALLAQGVTERGWVPLSGFLNPPAGSNPFGLDGYKSIAYEVYADLGSAPSVVVVPTAYADGLTGIARGFEDLKKVGLIEREPRLVAAEPFGPLEAALRDGFDPMRSVPGRVTDAFSIASPLATYQGYHSLRANRGSAVPCPEDSLIPTQLRLAQTEGLYIEASSVTTVVAVEQLAQAGALGADDVVVAIGTSTGLKDIAATSRHLKPVPLVTASLTSLDEATELGAGSGAHS